MSRITPFSAIPRPSCHYSLLPRMSIRHTFAILFKPLAISLSAATLSESRQSYPHPSAEVAKKWSEIKVLYEFSELLSRERKKWTHNPEWIEEKKEENRKQKIIAIQLSIKTTFSYQFNWFSRSILLRYNNINGSGREREGERFRIEGNFAAFRTVNVEHTRR